MFFSKMFSNLIKDSVRLVRFYSQNEHRGKLQHLGIEGGGLRSGRFGERGNGRFAWITGDDLLRGDQSGANKTLRQGSCHLAGSQKTDRQLGGHGWRCSRSIQSAEAKTGHGRYGLRAATIRYAIAHFIVARGL